MRDKLDHHVPTSSWYCPPFCFYIRESRRKENTLEVIWLSKQNSVLFSSRTASNSGSVTLEWTDWQAGPLTDLQQNSSAVLERTLNGTGYRSENCLRLCTTWTSTTALPAAEYQEMGDGTKFCHVINNFTRRGVLQCKYCETPKYAKYLNCLSLKSEDRET